MLEPKTFAGDSGDFATRLDERKRDACKLARLIETAAMESRQAAYETWLAKVRDPFNCRPDYGGTVPAPLPPGESGAIAEIPRRTSFPTKPASAAKNHAWPGLRRDGSPAQALSVWRRYQRLPPPVRRLLDPAANALKRLVRPLVRPPRPSELGGK